MSATTTALPSTTAKAPTSYERRQALERTILAVVSLGQRLDAAVHAGDTTAAAELFERLQEARRVLERATR